MTLGLWQGVGGLWVPVGAPGSLGALGFMSTRRGGAMGAPLV